MPGCGRGQVRDMGGEEKLGHSNKIKPSGNCRFI